MEAPWTDTPPTRIREACKPGRISSDRGRHPVSYRYRISNPVKRTRLLNPHVCTLCYSSLLFPQNARPRTGGRRSVLVSQVAARSYVSLQDRLNVVVSSVKLCKIASIERPANARWSLRNYTPASRCFSSQRYKETGGSPGSANPRERIERTRIAGPKKFNADGNRAQVATNSYRPRPVTALPGCFVILMRIGANSRNRRSLRGNFCKSGDTERPSGTGLRFRSTIRTVLRCRRDRESTIARRES